MAREVVRIEGLEGVLDALRKLPAEIVSKAGGPVKAALKKSAEVVRDEAISNVVNLILTPNADGIPYDGQYTLAKNIVATRGRMRGQKGERFTVRIRRVPYDVGSKAKPVSTPQVGRLLEYGSERVNPHPWLRPAFDSKKNEALQVFASEMNRRVKAVIDRLERQAKRK